MGLVSHSTLGQSSADGSDHATSDYGSGADQKFYGKIRVWYEGKKSETLDRYIGVFQRVFVKKSGSATAGSSGDVLSVKLAIFPKSLSEQSYRIIYRGSDEIEVSSADANGILYGLGKLLHSSVITSQGLKPNGQNIVSSPSKPLRAIYFATHFFNFYHVAPIEDVKEYIEELALWGYNHLGLWFDMHHYEGIADQEAQRMLDRLSEMYKAGIVVGMRPFALTLANEGYKNTPDHLKATKTGRSHYGVEICPSTRKGEELILKNLREEFGEFSKRGVRFDLLSLWPYDQGGCGCEKCYPWGGNGFISICQSVATDIRKQYPDTKVSLSTWLFDYGKDQGEWTTFARYFETEQPTWADYLLADSHTTYPEYLLSNPVPGNLPLINFPEISMWEQWPWGGFGASPLPERFQGLWNTVKERVAGGWPYSEGIFEDINKIIYSQFYWDENIPAKEVLKEYISFEYSADFTREITDAIMILEKNHGLSSWNWYRDPEYGKIDVPDKDFGSEKAYRMLKDVDQKLPEHVRSSWRWRILLIRAMMDYELRASKGNITPPVEDGLRELCNLFHVRGGEGSHRVTPPVNNGAVYRKISGKEKITDGIPTRPID